MRWTVEVEEPNREIGATCAMIHVTEDSTERKNGQDTILLGVDDAERLIEVLMLAVLAARVAEEKAKAALANWVQE